MSDYESVLRVFWDADSLFRLASTKLPEEQSATLTILRLTVLNLLVSVTSVDALEEALRSLRDVYRKDKSGTFVRRLRRVVRQHFRVVSTPSSKRIQAALSEVSDPSETEAPPNASLASIDGIVTGHHWYQCDSSGCLSCHHP